MKLRSSLVRRTIVIGLSVVVVVLAGWFTLLNWQHTGNDSKTEIVSYIVMNDGTITYGNYCQKDGTILDGGLVCYAYSINAGYYSGAERVSVAAAVMALTLAIGGSLVVLVAYLLDPRDNSKPPSQLSQPA